MPCARSTSVKNVGKARDAENASGAAIANHDFVTVRRKSAVDGTAKRYALASSLANMNDARSARNRATETENARSASARSDASSDASEKCGSSFDASDASSLFALRRAAADFQSAFEHRRVSRSVAADVAKA